MATKRVVTPDNLSNKYFDIGENTTNKIEYKLSTTISNLKTATNIPDVIFILDNNKESIFEYDSSDTTSVGDDLNIIVTNSGKRYKRKTILISEYNNIVTRLNTLEYIPQTITSFTNNINTVEKGSIITSITFNFTFNKIPTTASINNGIGTVTGNSKTSVVNLTSNTTYTLTANDGTTTVTSNTSVTFLNKVYWGTSANTTLSNSEILSLNSNVLSSTKNRTITLNGNGQYIYYCYPASMGGATFTFNGSSVILEKTTLSVTNTLGDVTLYNIYKTGAIQNGTNLSITIN